MDLSERYSFIACHWFVTGSYSWKSVRRTGGLLRPLGSAAININIMYEVMSGRGDTTAVISIDNNNVLMFGSDLRSSIRDTTTAAVIGSHNDDELLFG